MALRPLRPRRPPRRASRVRDVPIVVLVATIVVACWLRAIMALLGVAEWLAAWRLVNAITLPAVRVLHAAPLFDEVIVARLTIADIFLVLLVTVGAMFALASLAIRRGVA